MNKFEELFSSLRDNKLATNYPAFNNIGIIIIFACSFPLFIVILFSLAVFESIKFEERK